MTIFVRYAKSRTADIMPRMLLKELDTYFREIMDIDDLVRVDNSLNGIQVGRLDAEITKVAFAVDACMETFERVAASGANLLFVHHGLFWGANVRVTRSHYDRISHLISNDCALYAVHLPLDLHPEFGNNAGIAAALDLGDTETFGEYHGVKIGFKGTLSPPLSVAEVLERLKLDRDTCNSVLPFGKKKNATVGIVSGGGTREFQQAVDQNLDLYITGDASHTLYHQCLEEGVNLISGGHYQTEVWGVSLLMQRLQKDTGIPSVFIDVPTGL